jgi:hypothetical protein
MQSISTSSFLASKPPKTNEGTRETGTNPIPTPIILSSENLSSNNSLAILNLLEFYANSFPGYGKRSADGEDVSGDTGEQPSLKLTETSDNSDTLQSTGIESAPTSTAQQNSHSAWLVTQSFNEAVFLQGSVAELFALAKRATTSSRAAPLLYLLTFLPNRFLRNLQDPFILKRRTSPTTHIIKWRTTTHSYFPDTLLIRQIPFRVPHDR